MKQNNFLPHLTERVRLVAAQKECRKARKYQPVRFKKEDFGELPAGPPLRPGIMNR